MFQVKICGITSVDDAVAVARAGADAIGLNFYRRSPRYVTVDAARDIVQALPPEVIKVGLFVNGLADGICRIFDELQLDLIQLHGDEPPEFLGKLGDRPTLKVFRVGTEGLGPITDYLQQCRKVAILPALVMLDAVMAGSYGGTGRTAD